MILSKFKMYSTVLKRAHLLLLFFLSALSVHASEDSLAQLRNRISVGYEYSVFNRDLSPWNTAFVEGKFRAKSWVVVPKFSFSQRFDNNGYLLESEFYRKFESKDYLMLQAGGTSSDIFYRLRANAEYYNQFKKVWEHSFGGVYMLFPDTVSIGYGTASLSRYYGNFLTTLRLNGGASSNSETPYFFNVSLRQRLYHSKVTYTGITLGYGYDPVINVINNNADFLSKQASTVNVSLETVQRLSGKYLISGNIAYTHFDFGLNQRDQFSILLKLIRELR